MQISKTYLALCAAVIGIFPLSTFGADTDAQAKAREALERELYGAQAQSPGVTNAPISDQKAREAIHEQINQTPAAQTPLPQTTPPKTKTKKRPAKAPAPTTATAPRPKPPAQTSPTPAT